MLLRRLGRPALLLLATLQSSLALAELSQTLEFDIAAQPLQEALIRYSAQSGVQVTGAAELIDGKSSSGVAGSLPARMALLRLLEGTHLTYEVINETTVAIHSAGDSRSSALPGKKTHVRVVPREAAAPLSGRSADLAGTGEQIITVFGRTARETLREVPQSALVFGSELIQDTAAVRLEDMVRFIPSAAPDAASFSTESHTSTIRGFSPTYITDGMNSGFVFVSPSLVDVQRVEVLQGAAGVLYGAADPGGIINLVSKRPQSEFHADFGMGLGSYGEQRYVLDVGGPITHRIRARLNAAFFEKESFIVDVERREFFASPVVEFDLGEDTLLTVKAAFSKDDLPDGYHPFVPATGSIIAGPFGRFAKSVNPGAHTPAFENRETRQLSARVEHSFAEHVKARIAYKYTLTGFWINALPSIGRLRDDGRTMQRGGYYVGIPHDGDGDGPSNQYYSHNVFFDLNGEFGTGPLLHRLVVGGEFRADDGGSGGVSADLPDNPDSQDLFDLYDPSYAPYTGPGPTRADLARAFYDTQGSRIAGLFVQDRVAAGERLKLLASVRYQKYQDHNTSFVLNDFEQTAHPTQIGALYELSARTALFANRSESFMTQNRTDREFNQLGPEEGVQYEIGAKFAAAGGGIQASIAAFNIEKSNLAVYDEEGSIGTGFTFFKPLGRVGSRGIEAQFQGQLRPGWLLSASASHLESRILVTDQETSGNELRNTPSNTLSLFSRYDFQAGALTRLALTTSVVHIGARFPDEANSYALPGYTTVDLGAHYTVSERLLVELLARNITDEYSYTGRGGQDVFIDGSRTFLAQAKLRY